MDVDVGRSLSTDYFLIAGQLTREELSYLQRTRDFVDNEVLPVINGTGSGAEFPWPVVEKLAKLGIVGDGIHGSCTWELNRGDGSLGTFVGVHAGRVLAGTRNALAWGTLAPTSGSVSNGRRGRRFRLPPRGCLGR